MPICNQVYLLETERSYYQEKDTFTCFLVSAVKILKNENKTNIERKSATKTYPMLTRTVNFF